LRIRMGEDRLRSRCGWLAGAAVLLLMFVVAGPAWCDGGGHASEMESRLGLSAEQKAQLQGIHGRYKNLKQDLYSSISRLRRAVADEINAEKPNRASIDKGLQEIVVLEGRRQRVMVDEYFEVLAVLRPEQQKIFREHVMQRILRPRR